MAHSQHITPSGGLLTNQFVEAIQQATFEISEAVHTADDLPSFYGRVHAIVQTLMPAKNFYIALYDAASGMISFPYFVDETEPAPRPFQIGKGLTMVLVFSLGLAASLVAIGLAVVNGLKAARRFIDTERYAAKVAFASALVVTLIGVGTLYSSITHFSKLP